MMTPIQQQRQHERRERILTLMRSMVLASENSKSLMRHVPIPKADITELSIHLRGFFNALDEDLDESEAQASSALAGDLREVLAKHGYSSGPTASSSHPGYDDFRREGGRFGD